MKHGRQAGNRVKITDDVLLKTTYNRYYGPWVLELVLNHCEEIKITETMLLACLRGDSRDSCDVLSMLLAADPNAPITDRVWRAAHAHPDSVGLRKIMSRYEEGVFSLENLDIREAARECEDDS